MSIVILNPPPKKPGTSTALATADAGNPAAVPPAGMFSKLESEFLHLIGLEGHQFADWAAVRDFAQAQIDAAKPAE